MKRIFRGALIAALAFLTLAAMTPAKAQFLPVYGRYGFIKGANLPWLDGAYSSFLGIDPHHTDWGVSYNSNSMNAHLADMHKMGINVLRLWIFSDDMGCTLDGSGNVTSVTPLFWANLDDTVRLAGNNGIALYLCMNGGRADFLKNPTMLNAFITKAYKPLIQRYKGDQRVFAIDAMNEIDGVVAGSDGDYLKTGATWPQAQSYMRTMVSTAHSIDPTRLVSCSSGWHAWYNLTKYFTGQNLDFYDFHQYDDTGYVPSASSFGLDKPLYMGESGQSSSAFSDTAQNNAEIGFLNNAKTGYAGVGIWAYQYPTAGDVHQMLNSDGSWRPVCYTIQSFSDSNVAPPLASGVYKITNRVSGLALDAFASGTANGTLIDLFAYNAGANQRWNVSYQGGGQYTITNLNAGRVLDVTNSGGAGTWTELWDSNGGANQRWVLTPARRGYYQVSPASNAGLALGNFGGASVSYGGGSTGRADVGVWTGGNDQQWAFQTP